jgi:hypothetical protein
MSLCRWDVWKTGIALLLGMAILSSGVAWGEGPQPEGALTPEEEGVAERPPEKPPVKPPYPEILPPVPPTTFEVGPTTGILAPYGNPAAEDTLRRGWRSHSLGMVRFSPYLEYDALYRTNIYQTPTDKKAAFVNVINPGLAFEVPLVKRGRISVGYLGNYFFYTPYGNNSHLDHNVNTDAVYNFPWGLNVRVGNTFRSATEERTAETGRLRPYYRVTPYFQAVYKLADRWKIEGNYQFDDLTFAQNIDRINNYQQQTWGTTLYYKFWPKTSALMQYILTYRSYPSISRDNNISHTPLLGLAWDPTSKLSGTIKFGYTFKEYEQNLQTRNNSPQSWILSMQTLYRYSKYTYMSLVAQRSIQEDEDQTNNVFVNSAVFVTLNHTFTRLKLNSYIVLSYSNNAYTQNSFDFYDGEFKRREDNIFSAGGGFSRSVTKWLTARLDYLYSNKSSNFFGFGYNEHKVLLGLQTSF